MNLLNQAKEEKLKKLLDHLNLSSKNKRIALQYLTAEVPEESLLDQAEPQNFRLMGINVRLEASNILQPLREGGKKEQIGRFYRLFWAIGKSTACYVMTGPFRFAPETPEEISRYLDKAAAAALAGEILTQNNSPDFLPPWLWKMAESEPEALIQGQGLCGEPIEGRAEVMLAGLVLSKAKVSQQEIRQQVEILLNGQQRLLPAAAHSLSPGDKQLLTDYISAGDPCAPMPLLSYTDYYATGVQNFWNTHSTDDRLGSLLGVTAMMGQRLDPRLRCAAKVHLALNPRIVLTIATQLIEQAQFMEELPRILEDLPGGMASLLLFLTAPYPWIPEDWRSTLARRCTAALPEVLAIANPNQFSALTELLPGPMKTMGVDVPTEAIRFLQNALDSGEEELFDYLRDTGSLANSAQQLKNVVFTGYNIPFKVSELLRDHRLICGWDDFHLRCAVVMGTVFNGAPLSTLLSEKSGMLNTEEIPKLCLLLRQKGLDLTTLLDLMGNFRDHTYWNKPTEAIDASIAALLSGETNAGELCQAAKNGSLFTRQHSLRKLNQLSGEDVKEGMLSCTADSSKAIQNLLAQLLPAHSDWAPEFIALLKSKKAPQRILAAQILGKMGSVGTAALQEALEVEKSAKVADAIQSALGDTAKPPVSGAGELVQRLVNANKVKKIQWLLSAPLPGVHLAGGEAPEEPVFALLIAYSELGRIGRSDIASQISGEMDPKDLEVLADEVFERWIAAGAPAKHKWVLAFSAVYGGETVCAKLIRAINDWPQNARGAIACDGVKALTLSTAPGALLAVDAISRKFKFRQVKVAAAAALDSAAQELGISVEELADRIVPDLGFDETGKRVFDYGKRSFTVRLTPTLELSITNDAGKAMKNLPAPGKTDEEPKATESYEAFKSMKKQIRTTVSTQKARLEAALGALRCWNRDSWNTLFVRNPIMHQFAISLVWGVYENGVLTDTFRYMEDGSFNTVDEEEYALPEACAIGLVHPVELDSDLLEGWKQQLEDYEVTQSIPQLDRPLFLPADSEQGARVLETFGGKQLNGLSLSGKLTTMGWYRGSVVDGGAFYTYWREDPSLGIGVELRFSGSFVGDENEDVTVYDAVFYRAGTVTRGSYNYDHPKEEDIFTLGQIPARYYSEILQQLTKATASSTTADPNWKDDRKDG